MGVGVGVGVTTATPPPVSAELLPEPPPHAVMERSVARATELWLKIRTPNFPFKHCLKDVCQKLDKACLSKVVNDFPSAGGNRIEGAGGNGNDTVRACVATSDANSVLWSGHVPCRRRRALQPPPRL